MSTPVPQKYARFETQNDVHCNVKPNFNTAEESEPSLSSNNMSYAAVNGHAADFVKTEDLSNTNSSYNTSACENVERTMPRVSQQYGGGDFVTQTFTSRGQPSEKSRTPEFTGTFKQESGLLSPSNETSSNSNGLLAAHTKSEDEFRLLTDIDGNNTSKEDDLENQLSQFERVLQGIKSRDESSSESESSNDIGKTTILRPHGQPLGNGLINDGPDIKATQLSLPNDNATQLPTSSAQQYGISRSTAHALQQFVMAQQNERLASKVRFERNMYLNPPGEQNNPRMNSQRASHFPPVRQRVYQQLQQRKNLQLQKKITGATPQQLQARNPVMNPLGGNTAYQMHPKVRYSGPSTQQAVPSFTAGRIHQNLMQPLRQPVQQTQAQVQGQMANLPRHQINILAQQQQQQQQQKLAFQQQMASRLPSYSQAQHLARSSSVLDIRQKFSGVVPATHATQYSPMQATRAQQPLSHLQHYNPPGYSNQSGPPTRPVQVPYSGDYPGYQHPYQYGQENKLHSAYQRHASMDDNLVTNRFHNPELNQRNNFPYQRSSSLPGHAATGNNIFNQTSPPVVRLGQNEPNLPDMNNNGNDHSNQDLTRVHPQAPLTHMKQHLAGQSNNLGMNQEQLYQGNAMTLAQSRAQPSTNLIQSPLSNSFSNLLDMKSNSETSLFPFLSQDLGGGTTDSSDFDSLLKSPPDFDLINMLEEPQKALQ